MWGKGLCSGKGGKAGSGGKGGGHKVGTLALHAVGSSWEVSKAEPVRSMGSKLGWGRMRQA